MRSVLMIRLTSIVIFCQALERFVSSFQMRPEIGFVMLIASSNDCASHCGLLVMIGGSLPSQHVSVLQHKYHTELNVKEIYIVLRYNLLLPVIQDKLEEWNRNGCT